MAGKGRSRDLGDAGDRLRIVTDLDTNFLVEAAAGTGKTSSLVSRIAELVRSGKARISEIAAVTFTRKAASQLRERLAARLDAELAGSRSEPERALLSAARDEMDRAFLGTVHSFCSRLLRERPVEAGIGPDFAEPEEDEAVVMREEAWRLSLEGLRDHPVSLSTLIDLGVEPRRLHEAFVKVSEYPEVAIAARPVPPPDFSEALSEANGLLDEVIPVLQSLGRGQTPDDFGSAAWAAHYFRVNRDLRNPPAAAEFLGILRKRTVTQNRWPSPVIGKTISRSLKALQGERIEPALQQWQAHCHAPVMEFLGRAAAGFRAKRLASSRPNFTDLLLLCRDMLRDHPSVRLQFQERYPRLFVDEFQDTDPIQADVMLLLASSDPGEKDWRKTRPRPGSLFVVGDPKQSIYRFRRADIDTYNEVRRIIESSGGAVARLFCSFRSAPEVCSVVNGVFSSLFRPGTPHQATDVPLVPVRAGDPAGLPMGAFRLIHRLEGGKPDPVWKADAAAIAKWIAAAVRGGLRLSLREGDREMTRPAAARDFLVILRTAGHLDSYARALEEEGVPTAVAGGKALKDSEEVRAFVPFLQALADPDNSVPVVAFLRGMFCGVDDDALYRFRKASGRFHFKSPAPVDTDPGIVRAFEQWQQSREWLRSLPPGAAIARMAELLGILPAAYVDDAGERRAGNVEKTLGIARRLSAEGKSFFEIVEALGDLLERGEAPEMSIEPVKDDAVRVTNLHKAKGLEAPIVFLAGPLRDWRRDDPSLWVDRSTEPPRGHFFVRDDSDLEIARPEDWLQQSEIEGEHGEAEKSRLLYVAATRAMNTLVISGWLDTTTQAQNVHYGPWKDLDPGALPDLPMLPEASAPAAPAPEFGATSFSAAIDAIEASKRRAGAASYAISSPSKFEDRRSFVVREATGKGMAWGRVLHRLLEASMRDGTGSLDLSKYAENLLREEERGVEELPEVLQTLRAVSDSDVWRRARVSPNCLVEVPFASVVRSSDYGLPDPPGETLLNGAIDLVYKDEGVWKLIDYKTDTISGSTADLVAFYEPQLRAYRDQWEKLTGEKTEAGLYFIANGTVEWLK